MKKALFFILSAQLVFSSLSAQHSLVKLWETDSLFKVPESVIYDAQVKILYVTNIEGTEPWGRDGKGSISKLGLDGKIIQLDWITGLNCPKGMAIYRENLYVADLDKVLIIDLGKGKITDSIMVKGATGLNDISADSSGILYVTDSRAKKLYRVQNKIPSVYLDTLKGPNGVLVDRNQLYVLDAGGMYLVNTDKQLTRIADGMEGGIDGIENVAGKDYIVSCWAGVIWYINADGSKQLLLDTRNDKKNAADLGFDPSTRTVYVPTFWKNTVVAYTVK